MTNPTQEVEGAHPKQRHHDMMTAREIEALARDMCRFPDIRAPVQGYPGGIPWEMHMRAYVEYAKKWSSQVALIDLYGRGCRGGFSTGELDDFIPGWREQLSERTALLKRIAELEANNLSAKQEATRQIVSWLRGEVPTDYTDPQYDIGQNLANAIEQGQHQRNSV